jgi:NAD(P)-dependent dehydrogenase (short-subunit alcohol dehydrogenase family)
LISLEGRVAIVTGAGAGLGRSHALALAARGAKVVVNDVGAAIDGSGEDRRSADAVVDEIRAAGGTAVAEYSSVADPAGGERIVERALDAFGRVDALVNNAGNIQIASFAKLDTARVGEILDVHLGAAFFVTQPAYRAMIAQGGGRIVFTVSGVAAFGNAGASVYGAAKGGVLGLMSVLKLEAARHGVLVNAVAPMAQTRMAANVELPEYAQVTERSISPDLISPVVVYFASGECDLTGEVWSVASGSVARLFVARAPGFFKHPERDGMLTPEDVLANVERIRDPSGFTVPPTWNDEWKEILEHFRPPATEAQER